MLCVEQENRVCVCMCVKEKERETEIDRWTQPETEGEKCCRDSIKIKMVVVKDNGIMLVKVKVLQGTL